MHSILVHTADYNGDTSELLLYEDNDKSWQSVNTLSAIGPFSVTVLSREQWPIHPSIPSSTAL